ncbi:MAG: DNA polymerase III subunit gamma/tau [Candidatus Paceibacterota bacterium]|jgi:DNA polymerase-3 subunit gamma/tau
MNDNNLALYRKYRPNNFNEVLGQDHIVKVLEGALKLGNFSHAYLFSGSRGTGKTSVARIIAKEMGCSENDTIEIDAASNRGIDNIRELRESVRTFPFDSKYKVYIIDEVHMLTKEAFNALLKTLEEPPSHVIFILATTELEKVPETIISRCQTFIFKKPNDLILKNLVLDIAKKEKISIDVSSAELIALLGDGSFRDTQGILQKVISFSKDKKLNREEVEQVTGAPSLNLINDFITALSNKNIDECLSAIEKASKQNVDMKIYLKLILHKFRMIMIYRFAENMRKDIEKEVSVVDLEFLKKLVKENDGVVSSKNLGILLECYQTMDNSFIKELPLELAIMKILKTE